MECLAESWTMFVFMGSIEAGIDGKLIVLVFDFVRELWLHFIDTNMHNIVRDMEVFFRK